MSSDPGLTSLISRGLYGIVSNVIGPESVVKLRREKFDISNVLRNCSPYNVTEIMSGSKSEGIDMKASDFDFMFVLNDVVVLPSYIPLPERNPTQKCVLIYETDYTSPGFAAIRCNFLIDLNTHRHISNSLVWKSLGPYVFSKMFREYFFSFFPAYEIHGPCVSGKRKYYEFDFAFCLHCPYWPREASSFITRSFRSGWPSRQIVNDICNDGCLFVPISSKMFHCQDAFDMEWRMSFSLAEKKLVYSMNHCQFLCYGLLKLFLNEVLKKIEDIKDLLCSYFLKTAVFWEISEDTSGWNAENFLCKFWKTFCRLMTWVRVGYCPNFFNPNNNMFAGKIHGHKQGLLFQTLCSLHNDGELSLLKCSSLNAKLTSLFQFAILSHQANIPAYIPLNEDLFVPQWYFELQKLNFILDVFNPWGNKLSHLLRKVQNIRNVRPTSTLMNEALKNGENVTLQEIGEAILRELANISYHSISNKAVKNCLHTAMNIFCRNGTTYLASEITAAKLLYILGMFQYAVTLLRNVRIRVYSSQFMYSWALEEAEFRRLFNPSTSYSSFLKSNIVHTVNINKETTISELHLELAGKEDTGMPCLCIPPSVFVDFLLVLSYHRLGDTVRRDDVLRNLRVLLCYDENYHIRRADRAISWEILGICQQLCGDYDGAYQSYINALNDEYNEFKKATIIRIVSLTNN